MDARSDNIAASRRSHPLSESDAGLDRLRSNMIEAEDRIVEDVDRLQEMLTPERIANRLVSAVKDELFMRFGRVGMEELREVGNKVRTSIKKHPFFSTLTGLGLVGGAVAYCLLKNSEDGLMEQDIQVRNNKGENNPERSNRATGLSDA